LSSVDRGDRVAVSQRQRGRDGRGGQDRGGQDYRHPPGRGRMAGGQDSDQRHRRARRWPDEPYVIPSRGEPAGHVGRAPADAPSQRLGIDVVAGRGDALNTQDNVCATTPNTTTSAMYTT